MKFSKRYKFSSWPNKDIPMVTAGVYAIWNQEQLIYCGMSGREIEKAIESGKKKFGLYTRLNAHASGRLSGDQFCVYIANRLVIPNLTTDDLPKFASGEYKLDGMTKTYIHEHLEYQFMITESSKETYALEDDARRGLVFGVKPYLNPIES